jgi:thiol-disulfide isomerase/thioredoxin
MTRAACALAIGLLSLAAWASDVRSFKPGSYAHIVREHAGKPFVLALWSLTCAPCHEDLALFGRLLQEHPALQVVLVSTDSPADSPALRETLARHHITRAESWVFADGPAEQLRFEIDRKWYGELPRTYLFSADGSAQAISGTLEEKALSTWLSGNSPRKSD